MDRLLIVDGNNIASRAWFTNNPYGFFNMLLTAMERLRPSHAAFVFDSNGQSWRRALYPGYKGSRAADGGKTEYINDIVRAMRTTGAQVSRIGEADDVIATLAVSMAGEDLPTQILSNDSDMLALASRYVTIVSWKGNFGNFEYITPSEVVVRFGITPNRVVDYKALVGDSSDNIPGVRGVGPVNARAALMECGTVTGILNAIADDKWAKRKPPWVKKVEADIDNMTLSYKLAAMRTNECVPIDPEKYRCASSANTIIRAAQAAYKQQQEQGQ